jgi:hypothetical protein
METKKPLNERLFALLTAHPVQTANLPMEDLGCCA